MDMISYTPKQCCNCKYAHIEFTMRGTYLACDSLDNPSFEAKEQRDYVDTDCEHWEAKE